MCVVRTRALDALAAAIATAVPALAGKVKVGQAPSNVEQTYPTLTIISSTLKYEPAQELEQATIGPASNGVVVFNVGAWVGAVQLRIVATTPGERYQLENDVANFFAAQEMRPGIAVVEITACADTGNWVASFEYEDDQWIDVSAQERKLESALTVTGVIPALVTRTGVYEIDQLALGLTEDFETSFSSGTLTPPAVEVVVIAEDGTISPYTP